MKHRNEQAHALFHRAGNVGTAVSVDTRPKTIKDKKKYDKSRDRKRMKESLKC